MRIALVKDGVVVNVTEGYKGWTPPDGYAGVELDDDSKVAIGWTYADKEFAAPVVKVIVPQSVTMRQARLALLGAGHLDAVQAAIDAFKDANTKAAAQITWDHSTAVERDNALLATLAPLLGLDDAAVDALFIAASRL
jgi:hypothetical protein